MLVFSSSRSVWSPPGRHVGLALVVDQDELGLTTGLGAEYLDLVRHRQAVDRRGKQDRHSRWGRNAVVAELVDVALDGRLVATA